jgi:uncharacterized protein (DUF302 family)
MRLDRMRENVDIMTATDGVVTKLSPYGVPETLDRLEAILRGKDVTIFVRVDHSGEAGKAGLQMPPTRLLIFGNPKAGTRAMLAAPLSAIDLPLKALAWQDSAGQCWLSYNDPEYFRSRFGLNEDAIRGIVAAVPLIEQAIATDGPR